MTEASLPCLPAVLAKARVPKYLPVGWMLRCVINSGDLFFQENRGQ